ncbi:hypothetical protein MTO96_016312 [Rhipicephalus appendiculatus]
MDDHVEPDASDDNGVAALRFWCRKAERCGLVRVLAFPLVRECRRMRDTLPRMPDAVKRAHNGRLIVKDRPRIREAADMPRFGNKTSREKEQTANRRRVSAPEERHVFMVR